MSNLLRCFGSTENRLHLGQTQTVPVWFGLHLTHSDTPPEIYFKSLF